MQWISKCISDTVKNSNSLLNDDIIFLAGTWFPWKNWNNYTSNMTANSSSVVKMALHLAEGIQKVFKREDSDISSTNTAN